MKLFLVIALIFYLVGCSFNQEPVPVVLDTPSAPLSDNDAIFSAVFIALASNNASAEISNKKGILLCVSGQDPSSALLNSFKSFKIKTYPCSAGRRSGEFFESVLRSTSEPVIEFNILDIVSQSKQEVTINASYYEALESSTEYNFILAHKSGKWVVVFQNMVSTS